MKKAVILTGQEDKSVAIEAMQLGAEDYLINGGSAEHLGTVVRFAVERRRRVLAEESLK